MPTPTDRKQPGTHRFFSPELIDGGDVDLPQGEAHHAQHVLRLPPGQAVELFDGAGSRAQGTISSCSHGKVTVRVQEMLPHRERPAPAIELAFAEPRGNRLDWLLEKAAELGAAVLQPVIFERSIAGTEELSENKLTRWMGHCISAAKQCELDFLPEIRQPLRLMEFLAASDVSARARVPRAVGVPPASAEGILPSLLPSLCLMGDLESDAIPMRQALADCHAQRIVILIGPEGSIAPRERSQAIEAGFVPIRLGHTILRVETAAIALLAAAVGMTQ